MADSPEVKFDNRRVILTIVTPVLCHFFRTTLTIDFPGQDDEAKWLNFATNHRFIVFDRKSRENRWFGSNARKRGIAANRFR